jgi:uncharacterized protein YjbJ (UPF0337 family)
MNKDQIAGNWKQISGAIRTEWGKLTDNDIAIINGNADILAGKLQERYGLAVEEAQTRIKAFEERLKRDNEVALEGDPVDSQTLKIGL